MPDGRRAPAAGATAGPAAPGAPGGADCLIAAALGWEARAVRAALSGVRRHATAGVVVWVGGAAHRRVMVVQTGVGPARVRDALAGVNLAQSGARWLVSTGCAGGLAPGLEPGSLVVATELLDHDGGRRGSGMEAPALRLRAWARRFDLELRPGPFLSMARPLLSAADKRRAHERLAAIAVEMEAAPLAALAAAHGMTFVGVRAILDPAETAVPDLPLGGGGLRDVAGAVVRRPMALLAAARLLPAQRAARSALDRFFRAFVSGDGLGSLEENARRS
jgi:nucleoside phosphorylase